MTFELPALKYNYDALEPYISKKTMKAHHTKHRNYVNNLNTLSNAVPAGLGLHEMISGLKKGDHKETGYYEDDYNLLLEHGGGHYNHSLFWEYMSKNSSEDDISATLRERITKDFGSLEAFKEQLSQKAETILGYGWCWYVFDQGNTSQARSFIMTTKFQENPLMYDSNYVCLLGLDFWEHAYYPDYMNNSKRYINALWKVVNWKMVSYIHDNIAVMKKKLVISNNGYIIIEKGADLWEINCS